MPSHALIIGIDDYAPSSGQDRLTGAARDARRMAAWLRRQDPSSNVWLVCSPTVPEERERPATRAGICDALLELQKAGRHAGPDDRLYLFYAGHGIGYFNDQLLLLPQDTQAGAYGERAYPWVELESWLRTTGFRTQICFLDTCRHEDENLANIRISARLPFDQPRAAPADVAQYVLYATGYGKPAYESDDAGVFSQALLDGLEGAAATSIDYDAGERVVRFEALRGYLEREVPQRTGRRQRCVVGGQIPSNPIVARLGPAGYGELRVDVGPPDAVSVSTVEIYRDNPPTPVETRTGPPFRFDLLQDELYKIVARAPGYAEHHVYSRVRPSPHVVHLRLPRPHEGRLSGRDAALAELSIEPGDPYLPLRLYDGNGEPVDLPPGGPSGCRLEMPPGRYRAVLTTPERIVEQEFELRAGRTPFTVPLPLTAPHSPVDRLLDSLERGETLDVSSGRHEAALLVLADEPVHPVTVEPLGAGEIRPAAPPTVPADIAGRVRGTYVGRPGLVALRLLRHDGHPCQLVLPLLAGRVTIAGIGTGDRHPSIELLLAPNPLRRRHRASQKRILWAQRFFKVEGRSDVLALVKGLDDEPLAVALAGYAALGTQDPGQALEHALRLQAETPDLHDGHILLAAAQHMLGRSPMDPTAGSRVPVMLAGLQSQVSTGREPSPSPSLALRLLSRAVLSQIWLLLDGDGDVRQDDVTSGPLRS